MMLSLFALLPLMEMSLGFNIDASAIRAAEATELGEGALQFGNITIPGEMRPTDLVFPDGLRLLLYSPNAQNLTVHKKDQPSAPSGFVTPLDSAAVSLGSGFWTAIYNYSWSIRFEAQNVDGMVAAIEVPYDRETLESMNIRHENVFLASFNSTRGGWVVDTSRISIDSAQNKTRIVGLTSLDREYMLLGRQTADSHGTFIYPGSSSEASDLKIEGPPADSQGQTDPSKAPVQIGTWIDGFQLEVRSCKAMRVNMNFFNASEAKIQQGFEAVSPYGYMLNSSDADSKVAVTARLPLRPSQIEARSLTGSRLRVAQLDSASGEFWVTHHPESNATSTLLRVLPRAVEIEVSTLDVKWLLVSTVDQMTSRPSLAVTTPPPPTSTITGDPQVLATNTPSPSPSAVNNPIASITASPSSIISVVTPLTEEGAEKVMKIEKVPRIPSRSRMRRTRYSKSEVL